MEALLQVSSRFLGLQDEKKRLSEEFELLETKARRRSLGNIRFIGELFKLKMLTESIMHDCLLKLLRSNDEDSLECLCRLLTTVGKELDHAKAKVGAGLCMLRFLEVAFWGNLFSSAPFCFKFPAKGGPILPTDGKNSQTAKDVVQSAVHAPGRHRTATRELCENQIKPGRTAF